MPTGLNLLLLCPPEHGMHLDLSKSSAHKDPPTEIERAQGLQEGSCTPGEAGDPEEDLEGSQTSGAGRTCQRF